MKIGVLIATPEEVTPALSRVLETAQIELRVLGMGRVNAAIAVCELIQSGCGIIINIGICGALDPALRKYDLVWPERIDYHDANTSMTVSPEHVYYSPEDLLGPALRGKYGILGGVLATGDSFIEDRDTAAELRRSKGATIVDMEAAAVVQVCERYGAKCIILKSVSDACDAPPSKITYEGMDLFAPILEDIIALYADC